jgi:hypothetical protein
VTAQNAEACRKTELKKLDQRHEQIRSEERLAKFQKEVSEQQRIEMNRRMNRPGQNVDRMAE